MKATENSEPAQPLAVPLSDQLGLPPAYLGDGQTAYAAGIVASWPEHNRARFRKLLFTGEQLERAVAAERERWAERVEEAFRDGYWARETYNDSEVSDADEKWASAKAALLRA